MNEAASPIQSERSVYDSSAWRASFWDVGRRQWLKVTETSMFPPAACSRHGVLQQPWKLKVDGDVINDDMTSVVARRRIALLPAAVVVAMVLVQSVRPVYGCILLLDGWSPMSVAERARLSEVVAVGVVRRTYKTGRSTDTYTAQVLLVDVLKGNSI